MDDYEVVEAQLLAEENGGAWRWRALHGQPHFGCGCLGDRRVQGLSVGDRLVLRVQWKGPSCRVLGVVRLPEGASFEPVMPSAMVEEDQWWPAPVHERRPLEPGDVIVCWVPFSKSDGSGRGGKRRPCIVRQVRGAEVVVRPVYGTNTSLRRTGAAKRLKGWKKLGLRKPSVVSAEDLVRPIADGRTRFGRLEGGDRQRLLADGV